MGAKWPASSNRIAAWTGGAFGETRVCGNADYAQGSHVRDAVSFWLLVGLTATSAAVGVFAISRLVPERRDDRVPDHDVS